MKNRAVAFLVLLVSFFIPVIWVTESPAASIFLPLIGKSCSVPIPNGDFEQGRTLWTEFSIYYPLDQIPLVVDREYIDAYSPGITPRGSGNWAGWLCGIDFEVHSIKQQLTVPATCPMLTYWQWIDSEAPCGVHFAYVIVTQGSDLEVVDTYDLCFEKNTYGWIPHQVDLRPYAGQSVELEIMADCQSFDYSSLFLDDVAFQGGLIQ